MIRVEIKNARIEEARLLMEGDGTLVGWVNIDYGSSNQSFGGLGLYCRGGKNDFTGLFICRVMEVVGVDEWANLVGKTIRVKATRRNVEAIGNILEDRWFNIEKEFKKAREYDKNT